MENLWVQAPPNVSCCDEIILPPWKRTTGWIQWGTTCGSGTSRTTKNKIDSVVSTQSRRFRCKRHSLSRHFKAFHMEWNGSKWQKRKRNCRFNKNDAPSDMIGPIHVISLNAHQSELYFLRMLLHHQTGATSFADLRTVEEKQKRSKLHVSN